MANNVRLVGDNFSKIFKRTSIGVQNYILMGNQKKITRKDKSFVKVAQTLAMAAVYCSDKSNIKAIATLTYTGSTQLWKSRIESKIPIY